MTEPNVGTITPWSTAESIGTKIHAAGFVLSNAASAIWPTANLAIYVPFVLRRPITVAQLFWFNGAAVSGNVDIGLYTDSGARLVSSGTTVQATINVLQVVDIADIQIGPGLFWMALAMNNIIGTQMAVASGQVNFLRAAGVQQQATAFALPATSTPAALTVDYLPIFGLTTGSVI